MKPSKEFFVSAAWFGLGRWRVHGGVVVSRKIKMETRYVEALAAGIAGRFRAQPFFQGEFVTNYKYVNLKLARCGFGA